MEIIDQTGKLKISLFHATSTLFLNSILENGLAGRNVILEWKILDMAKRVYELSEQYLSESNTFIRSSDSFKKMVEQSNNGGFNFQHGQTYVSASKSTVIRYALSNLYGSEILSYTIKFLTELINLGIDELINLRNDFEDIFNIMNIDHEPLIIQIDDVYSQFLISEHGDDATNNLNYLANFPEALFDALAQQFNFRLLANSKNYKLTFWKLDTENQLYEFCV